MGISHTAAAVKQGSLARFHPVEIIEQIDTPLENPARIRYRGTHGRIGYTLSRISPEKECFIGTEMQTRAIAADNIPAIRNLRSKSDIEFVGSVMICRWTDYWGLKRAIRAVVAGKNIQREVLRNNKHCSLLARLKPAQ